MPQKPQPYLAVLRPFSVAFYSQTEDFCGKPSKIIPTCMLDTLPLLRLRGGGIEGGMGFGEVGIEMQEGGFGSGLSSGLGSSPSTSPSSSAALSEIVRPNPIGNPSPSPNPDESLVEEVTFAHNGPSSDTPASAPAAPRQRTSSTSSTTSTGSDKGDRADKGEKKAAPIKPSKPSLLTRMKVGIYF